MAITDHNRNELFPGEERRSCRTTAPVTAGRLVEFTGSLMVGPAAAASTKVAGVAAHTSDAAGDLICVVPEGVFRIRAEATIAAGDVLAAAGEEANAGSVAPIGDNPFSAKVGRARTDAAAGALCEVEVP